MSIRLAAVVAVALALAVLTLLIVSSRSVGIQDHSEHFSQLNRLDNSVATYQTLIDQLGQARRNGLASDSLVLQATTQLNQLNSSTASKTLGDENRSLRAYYTKELNEALALAKTIETQQNAVSIYLANIKERGPEDVQALRNANLTDESQLFYQLLLETITLGSAPAAEKIRSIESLILTAQNNENLQASSSAVTVQTIAQLLSTQTALANSWNSLEKARFATRASALRDAYIASYSEKIKKSENARILLSMFSVLLFASLGFLGYRLQSSYSETNAANEQLNLANEDLENRVQERTQELEQAFSDLKESQVQLVQAEKMSSLGQLVAGISHEINTPLLYLQSNQTVIQETLELFQEFVHECYDKLTPRALPSEDLDEVRKRYIDGLRELKTNLLNSEIKDELQEAHSLNSDSIKGLEELTIMARGLKDFSRLDRAPIDTFNINEGLERTLLIVKNLLKNRVEVVKYFGDIPAISCAPSQINQIFLNLISNAAQSIEGEGTITITTDTVDDMVSITIEDSGSGISPDVLEKIREPFFTTKKSGEGTGLGLSICDEILNSHDGRMEIDSVVGEGSAFTVLLPCNTGATESMDDNAQVGVTNKVSPLVQKTPVQPQPNPVAILRHDNTSVAPKLRLDN